MHTTLKWLIPLILLLGVFTASVGLFYSTENEGTFIFTNVHGQEVEMYGRGMYRNDSLLAGAGFRGTDAVTLFIVVPLTLAVYVMALRGSLKAQIVMIPVLFYFLYNDVSMTFAATFNSLFLFYAASFSISLFATIIALATFDVEELTQKIKPAFPHRGIAVFLFTAGIGTLFIWISELISPMLTGSAPANLGPYTTMFTHGFDSAVITPACVIAGIFIGQRKPLGYLLAAPLMIFCALIGVVVIGQTVSQTLAGPVFPIGVYIGMIGSWVIMGAFAIGLTVSFFRNLKI